MDWARRGNVAPALLGLGLLGRAWATLLVLLVGCATGGDGTPVMVGPPLTDGGFALVSDAAPPPVFDAAPPPTVDATRPMMQSSCTPGVRVLGSESMPNTTTVLGLGAATPSGMMPFLGANVQTSQEFQVCIPDDTLSFVLMAPLAAFSSFVSPQEGELIDSRSQDTYDHSIAGVDRDQLLHPASPDRPMGGGVYRFRVAITDGGTPSVFIALRRGTRAATGSIKVNLIYVDTEVSEADVTQIEAAFARFEAIYGGKGISIASVGVGTITGGSALLSIADFPRQYPLLVGAALDPASHLVDGAINLYIVRDITEAGAPLTGRSSGSPGFIGYPREGVVIAIAPHRLAGGALDGQELGLTFAHEVAHFLGLTHTSEANGARHDRLSDTPECQRTLDRNMDGKLTLDECTAVGAENLMFWDSARDGLSEQQALILRASPGVSAP